MSNSANIDDLKVEAPVSDEEFSGTRRILRSWEAKFVAALCVTFTLFHLFVLNVYALLMEYLGTIGSWPLRRQRARFISTGSWTDFSFAPALNSHRATSLQVSSERY